MRGAIACGAARQPAGMATLIGTPPNGVLAGLDVVSARHPRECRRIGRNRCASVDRQHLVLVSGCWPECSVVPAWASHLLRRGGISMGTSTGHRPAGFACGGVSARSPSGERGGKFGTPLIQIARSHPHALSGKVRRKPPQCLRPIRAVWLCGHSLTVWSHSPAYTRKRHFLGMSGRPNVGRPRPP